MATSSLKTVIRHLRRAVAETSAAGDGQLLGLFVARRDQAAFEALVRRHGPMVLGVCRRLLRHRQDAEDAFQASFLVLVRRAADIRQRELLGNWLYGVAYRTALEARSLRSRRRDRERQVDAMPEPPCHQAEDFTGDWRPVLDQELNRLPDKYRVAVVLCEIEGRGRKEVARHLGIPEGTLSSRLAAARKLLARRLSRRGVVLTIGSLSAALGGGAVSAALPPALVESTVKAAVLTAAGPAAFAGVISTGVVSLTEGVLKAMFLTKLKTGVLLLIALGFLVLAGGVLTHELSADEGTQSEIGKSSLRDTLLVLDKQFWEASAKHDLDTLKRLVADDYQGIGHDGTRWNKAALLQQMSEVRTGDLKVLTDREVLRAGPQAAILTYEASFKVYNRDGTLRDTARQRLSSCWVQRDGGWFVFFAQVADRREAGVVQRKIKANEASIETLRALQGLTDAEVEMILDWRARQPQQRRPGAQEAQPQQARPPAKPAENRRNTLQKALINEIDPTLGTISTTLAVDVGAPAQWLTPVLDNRIANFADVYLHKNAAVEAEVFLGKNQVVQPTDFLTNVARVGNPPYDVLMNSLLLRHAKLENLPVAKDAKITIDGKPGKLADLKPDMVISLELAIEGNRLVVKGIRVEK